MTGAIFISYRRDDSEGEAGRLYDDLVRSFEPQAVFMDVSDIHPGKDFRKAIDDNVAKCTVLLAVIGPGWTTIKDASGARRLDQPNDFVRLEIASALARGVDVIPVLVHGASMPTPADLPDNLRDLAYRNGVELTHARWNSDVLVLARALRDYVNTGSALPTRVLSRAIGEEPPASETPAPAVPSTAAATPGTWRDVAAATVNSAGANKSKSWIVNLAWGISILVITGFVLYQHRTVTPTAPPEPQASPSAPERTGEKPTAGAYIARLSGTWMNPQPQNGKPVRVQIGAQGDLASIRLWTQCGTATCDMGTKVLPLHGDGITVNWPGQFSNLNDQQAIAQTVSLRIYRIGPNLHMIYGSQAGSTGWDMERAH